MKSTEITKNKCETSILKLISFFLTLVHTKIHKALTFIPTFFKCHKRRLHYSFPGYRVDFCLTHARRLDSAYLHIVIPDKTMLMWDDSGEARQAPPHAHGSGQCHVCLFITSSANWNKCSPLFILRNIYIYIFISATTFTVKRKTKCWREAIPSSLCHPSNVYFFDVGELLT